jgi:hypothetical protein
VLAVALAVSAVLATTTVGAVALGASTHDINLTTVGNDPQFPPELRLTAICTLEDGDSVFRIRNGLETQTITYQVYQGPSEPLLATGNAETFFAVAGGATVLAFDENGDQFGVKAFNPAPCDDEIEAKFAPQFPPELRLTAICTLDDGVGDSVFRVRNGLDAQTIEYRLAGSSDRVPLAVDGDAETFFAVPRGSTVVGFDENGDQFGVKAFNPASCDETIEGMFGSVS